MRQTVLALISASALACEVGGREQPGDSSPAHPPGALGAVPRATRSACDEIARAFGRLGADADVAADSFPAFSGPGKRFGCVVDARGVLGDTVTVQFLTGGLPRALGPAWRRDEALVTDGPDGAAYGVRREDVLCIVRIGWRVRDDAGEARPYTANVGCS